MQQTDLSHYNNSGYRPGGLVKRLSWYGVDMLFFKTLLPFPSGLKTAMLRAFGAKVGSGVVIKPDVHIKYPWFLEIGDQYKEHSFKADKLIVTGIVVDIYIPSGI